MILKRLVATVNRSGDKLEENYMDSLADNIIALFALKASHKAKRSLLKMIVMK